MRQHRFLLYPAGAPGVGLLTLRLSVFLFLVAHAATKFAPISVEGISLDGLACLIGLGLWTRSVACLSAAVAVSAVTAGEPMLLVGFAAHGLDAVVLAICGPGAFSLDARLFGRATVHLPRQVHQADVD